MLRRGSKQQQQLTHGASLKKQKDEQRMRRLMQFNSGSSQTISDVEYDDFENAAGVAEDEESSLLNTGATATTTTHEKNTNTTKRGSLSRGGGMMKLPTITQAMTSNSTLKSGSLRSSSIQIRLGRFRSMNESSTNRRRRRHRSKSLSEDNETDNYYNDTSDRSLYSRESMSENDFGNAVESCF